MEWIEVPELSDLVLMAGELGIPLGNKTRTELLFELAQVNPEAFPDMYVYRR